ncbi:MAG: proteinral secretion pathway protein D [Gammaproteobacteria bacterium]|nr:MAG: proteinral secretion pathway protein D [Gammaproteobacteria bacterium]TND02465.1 MAG: proteinral secretion pathway protein D [Gammaproteobacteria bacterium]
MGVTDRPTSRSGRFPRSRWRVTRATLRAVAATVAVLWALPAASQPVTFNAKDAEIAAVVGTVAEITGKNFIVDPRVKGKVTIISSRPMEKQEVYDVFLSILEVHGFAAVPLGNTVKIIPAANAKQSAVPIGTGREPTETDEVVTRVIEIENVAASQLVPILRPLIPQQGHLVAYPPSNILIISDRAANIERLLQIIRRIDKRTVDEVEIVPLKYASAAEVVRVLTALQQQANKGAQQGGEVDQPTLMADERTNSILIGGGRSGRLQLLAVIAHLDTPLETTGDTHVVYLRYANAKDLVPVITGVGSSIEQEEQAKKGGAAAAPGRQPAFNIQADEATNSLVITAPPAVYRSLQAVIRQLDVRRAQVLVEAIIAEVSSDKSAELGVQWLFGEKNGPRNNPVGLINLGPAGSSIGAIAGAASGSGDDVRKSLASVPSGLTIGGGDFPNSGTGWGALLRALQGDSANNILSTPTLVTMDNVEAEISVGNEVPFTTGSFTTSTNGANNPFQTIERKKVGLTLKVKPQVNEGNTVRLNIEQNVDSLAGSGQDVTLSITNTRSIKTTVMVDDGNVVVLGGLIRDNQTESVQKVPLLGDIPLLGHLFRYTTKRKDKTNLMVFLRPVILRDEALASFMTNSKYNFIRERQLESREIKSLIMRGERPALLPPIEEMMKLPPEFGARNSPAANELELPPSFPVDAGDGKQNTEK